MVFYRGIVTTLKIRRKDSLATSSVWQKPTSMTEAAASSPDEVGLRAKQRLKAVETKHFELYVAFLVEIRQ